LSTKHKAPRTKHQEQSTNLGMHTLYLCYFGLREPLVQTQVLPYLRELRRDGIEISLLTFEPNQRSSWTPADEQDWKTRLSSEGIEWHSLPYHKTPSALVTPYDILRGALFASSLARNKKIDVFHARGHIPAVMGALAKRMSGRKLVFDIRGFLPEEYTDAGVWPEGGFLFKTMKKVETYLFSSSDAFIVLTNRAREILFPGHIDTDAQNRPIEVIPCCVDEARFAVVDQISWTEARQKLGLDNARKVFVYVGSFGGWYMTDEMTGFLAQAHQKDASVFAMILTQSDAQSVSQRLLNLGLEPNDFLVRKVDPKDIPLYLRAADIAISFIRPCYSKLSSSPTKIAEYLASGLPVICNPGVGDLDELIETDRVGVLLSQFDEQGYEAALEQLANLEKDAGLAERCRASAKKRFSLSSVGGARYRRLYQRLMS
jgi:glycosyltransferase involved in cell wall biosynthesis